MIKMSPQNKAFSPCITSAKDSGILLNQGIKSQSKKQPLEFMKVLHTFYVLI